MGYSRFANFFESRLDHFREVAEMIGFLMSGPQTTKNPPPVKGTGWSHDIGFTRTKAQTTPFGTEFCHANSGRAMATILPFWSFDPSGVADAIVLDYAPAQRNRTFST
jgi:hypothetical protein